MLQWSDSRWSDYNKIDLLRDLQKWEILRDFFGRFLVLTTSLCTEDFIHPTIVSFAFTNKFEKIINPHASYVTFISNKILPGRRRDWEDP